MTKMISHFRKEYNWLSNFAPATIEYGNMVFSSVELFYIAMKTKDEMMRWNISLVDSSEAGKFKKISKTWELREDWDKIKLEVMEFGLRQKFHQEPFKSKLIETGNQNIVEGNYWNDEFWGVNLKVNPNVGENHLGRLIMKIRDELCQKK